MVILKKNWTGRVGHSKMLKGRSPKLIKSNLTYQLQTFIKHLTVDDNNNNAYWAEISAKFCQILAEMWAIIGEFDNFSQI